LSSWKGDRCIAPTTVVAHLLEDYVNEALQGPLDHFTLRRVYANEDGEDDLQAARDAMEAAERELSAFATDPHARTRLGDALWQQALDARADAVEAAQTAYRGRVKTAGIDADGEWLNFPGTTLFWLMEPEHRRVFYEEMIERCAVRRGRGPLSERVELNIRVRPKGTLMESHGHAPDAFLYLNRLQQIENRLAKLRTFNGQA
jgi:hypothetical protein